jgi:tetratricopeptide (TPR) repeat protein
MKRHFKNILLLLVCFTIFAAHPFAQKQSPIDKESTVEMNRLIDSYQYEQACLVADQMLSKDSLNVDLLIMKGRALAAGFQARPAMEVLTRAYLLDTANIRTLFELVNVCKQLGDLKSAIAFCQRIVNLDPESPFFNIQFSNLYYGIEDFMTAKNILLPLYRRDSLNTYVLKQLGNTCNELQQSDSAVSFYQKYLGIVPFDAGITGKLINLHIRKKDYPAGLTLSETFLANDSTTAGILKLNAYCRYLLKEYPVAAKQFSKCVTLGEKTKFTLKYLGLSYYKQEKYDLAEPIFRLAYQADTTDTEICFYYGVSAYRSALADTGVIYLQKTLKLLLPDPQFLTSLYIELAGAYTSNGQPDTALTILKSAYESNPKSATLAFHIAYQYDYHLRKPFQALHFYNEFLEKNKESEKAAPDLPQHISFYEFSINRVKEIKKK